MKPLICVLLAATCVWGAKQVTVSDSLTSVNLSKWTQTGSLSAGPNGVTGSGALVSTVPIATGADYDVSMTIHTAQQAGCTGSYSLYARSTPDTTTSYVLTVSAGSAGLYKTVKGGWTLLSWLPYYCADGAVLRMVVRGGNITTWSGPNTATYEDGNPIPAGQPGVGIAASADTIGNVQIGPLGYGAPAAVSGAAVEVSAAANRVELRWPASGAAVNGADLQGYVVYRDGVYLGSPLRPSFLDLTVKAGETMVYSIAAVDQHGNQSTPATVSVTAPAVRAEAATPTAESHGKMAPRTVPSGPSVDEREVGVRATGSYWGAGGENIDMLSGNLNFTAPMVTAVSRGGATFPFALSYNSQMWRKDTSVWLVGEDVGEGLGWTLQAGSILPVWYNGAVEYYLYADSTGAQYILDQNNGSGVWASLQSAYVWYDANAEVLHFPSGSFWTLGSQSASVEQDAGTLYPTTLEDSNGNQIQIVYGPATGYYWAYTNTSSRVYRIYDARCQSCLWGEPSYQFTYTNATPPHLTGIYNSMGTTENYAFSYQDYLQLTEPFTQTQFGSPQTLLGAVTITGPSPWQSLNISYSFQYNNSGEMTQMTTPFGGSVSWVYAPLTYPSYSRTYRVVSTRSVQAVNGGPWYPVTITLNPSTWNYYTSVTDATSEKDWSFSLNTDYTAGLVSYYQELDISRRP